MFNDISKDDKSTRIGIKRFRSSQNNFQRKPFTVQQVINECAIYAIVDISGLVCRLGQETTCQKEGVPLRIRKVTTKDQTGSIEIAFFSSVIDKISNNNCYDLKKMRIQKFMNNRILKPTESAIVTENSNINIELTDDELNASPFEKIVNAKIVKIDAKTLIQIYLCPTCNTKVIINNAVGWCDICKNAESQSECKLKTDVKIVILDERDQMKYYIFVPHSLIEKSINVSVSNTWEKAIAMKLVKKTFNFALDTGNNRCLHMCHST